MPALSRSRSHSLDMREADSEPKESQTQQGQREAEVERRIHPEDVRRIPWSFRDVVSFHWGNYAKSEAVWEASVPWKAGSGKRVHPKDKNGLCYSFEEFVDWDGCPEKAMHLWEKSDLPFVNDKMAGMVPLLDALPDSSHVAVVTLRGSLCPITVSHMSAFVEARNLLLGTSSVQRPARLENFAEVLGFIALNGDGHVCTKTRELGQTSLDIVARQHLVDLAIAEHNWIAQESSEAVTIHNLQYQWPHLRFIHFYMNGADDVVQYGKCSWSGPDARFITMGRPGFTGKVWEALRSAGVDPEAGYFIVGPELQDISSTEARGAILAGDADLVAKQLHPAVAEWCLTHWPKREDPDKYIYVEWTRNGWVIQKICSWEQKQREQKQREQKQKYDRHKSEAGSTMTITDQTARPAEAKLVREASHPWQKNGSLPQQDDCLQQVVEQAGS